MAYAQDWHFGISEKGYVDTAISLYWIRKVFDPSTRDRANGKPRVLVNDGFGTHESVEVLQPCDVGVFGPLKAAYRDQVDQLDLGGAGTVGKEHFTTLYDKAWEKAFSPRNIRSGRARAGRYTFNRDKVLQDIPQSQKDEVQPAAKAPPSLQSPVEPITPVTSEDVTSVFKRIKNASHLLDDSSRRNLEMSNNAALGALAGKSLALAQNDLLSKQNDEKKIRKSVKSKVVGTAKVTSYRDLKALEGKRDAKEAAKKLRKRKTKGKKQSRTTGESSRGKRSPSEKADGEIREMEPKGLADYCSVLQF